MKPSDFLPLLDTETRKRVSERSLAKGEPLFVRGDNPAFMFYVLSGEARLIRYSPTGFEVILQRTTNGFLAEASLEHSAYHCDGVAFAPTQVLAVPIAGFRAALFHDSARALWIRHLSLELRRVRAHSERLALRSADERVLHFIETEGSNGRFLLTQTKKSWASEMGLTHEALYRALRAMTDAGTIEISGSNICLRATHPL